MARTKQERALADAIPQETLEKLKKDHGDIYVVTIPNVAPLKGNAPPPDVIAFRAPDEGEVDRLMDQLLDEKKRKRAVQTITTACVVYPDDDAFEEMVSRRPGILISVGKRVQEVAGLLDEIEMGKA